MTSTLVTALLFIGALGCLGMSVLCPLLAMPAYYVHRRLLRKQASLDVRAPTPPTHVDIVIPAFNEVDFIGDTLASIQRSIQYLQSQTLEPPAPEISIRVAADGCTDKTAQAARQFAGVSVSESAVNHS